jgi:NAD(P)-dependent dehydrogenase (short-subunit alcohol dehydrogenase family)
MTLQGQRILVTGAGRGIGRAIALICQQEGAKVAIVSRTESQLQETLRLADCNPSQMMSLTCDVTDGAQVDDMVDKIVKNWGGLDVLVNNAGGAQPIKGAVDVLTKDSSSHLMDLLTLNVVSVHIVTSAVLRSAMLSNGHIVNISSKAGKVGLQNMSLYVASKFALEGLTSSWAKELKDRNIAVNSISPGMVDTKSFPKSPGQAGVRTAESIRDTFLMAINAPLKYSGHYVHADELDLVRKCELPDWVAWKPIDEPGIEEFLPPIPGVNDDDDDEES